MAENQPLDWHSVPDQINGGAAFGYGSFSNLSTIIHDGFIPARDMHHRDGVAIDFSANDALTRSLDTIEQRVVTRIEENPELQELLGKESWTREDRMIWEREVSGYISEEMSQIPGLDSYRAVGGYTGGELRTTSSLNDMSQDIENGTTTYQLACLEMSILEGIVLQRIEDNHGLLPTESSDPNDYRVAIDYGVVTLSASSPRNPEVIGHAVIVSPATMSVIESTMPGNDTYRAPQDPNYTMEDLLGGRNYVSNDTDLMMGLNLRESAEYNYSALRSSIGTLGTVSNRLEALPSYQQLTEAMQTREATGPSPELDDMIRELMQDPQLIRLLGQARTYENNAFQAWSDLERSPNLTPQIAQQAQSLLGLNQDRFSTSERVPLPLSETSGEIQQVASSWSAIIPDMQQNMGEAAERVAAPSNPETPVITAPAQTR